MVELADVESHGDVPGRRIVGYESGFIQIQICRGLFAAGMEFRLVNKVGTVIELAEGLRIEAVEPKFGDWRDEEEGAAD